MKSEEEKSRSEKSIFNRLPLFILNISLLFLFAMIGVVYLGGVARTMERRFSLRSSQTGLLFSCDNFSSVIFVLFIGYLARRGHKPRMISVTISFTAVAFLLMAMPHFWFDALPVSPEVSQNTGFAGSNVSFVPKTSKQVCRASADSDNMCNATFSLKEDVTSVTSSETAAVHPAYYVFALAQFIGGIGTAGMGALGISYIDENAPKTKTSLYMASSQTPEDPSFIGCWWLGYIICGFAVLLLAIPMWFFPKRIAALPSDEEKKTIKPEELEQKESKGILEKIKEFPRCILSLFRNPMYMLMIGCSLTVSYLIMGISVNMVRYIEIHFFERAFIGSLIASVAVSVSSALGTFLSGVTMTRFKLGLVGGVRIMIVSATCTALGLFIMFFISCPQVKMAGDVNPKSLTLNVLNECNRHCNCPSDRMSFAPVCGSDQKTYFSSCFAGCDDFINGTYASCACIGNNTKSFINSELASDSYGTAQHGLCIPECNRLVPFVIVCFITFMMAAFSVVPSTIVYLRSVNDIERPFALAFSKFLVDIFGFMPAPIIYGRLIDSTCLMWQRTAAIPSSTWFSGCSPPDFNTDDTGSCLLYDTAKVRRLMFGTTFGFKLCELLLLVFLNMVIVKMHSGSADKTLEVVVEQTEENGKFSYADDMKEESLKLKQPGTDDSDDQGHIAINGRKLEHSER